MASEVADLLIIGGGILGCGVARDAALRGLKVALVEKEDFGSGTTARSTRLAHGGLRYLELFDFGLVHQALQEREILLRIAPHLVHPLPFLTPIYRGDRWSPLMVRAGMILYDLLSHGKSLPRHRMLTPRQVIELEPGLKKEGLLGGALYYDAQVDFPERLCIENLLSAAAHGARLANYAAVRSLVRQEGRVVGAEVEDRLTGKGYCLRARVVINATGPWADEVVHLALPQAPTRLRRTKGIHLLVPSFTRHAVVLLAQRDGRVFFAVPWNGLTLIGTTDTDFENSPDTVRADASDVAYLVEETRRVFPRALPAEILGTMAGVRALVRSRRAAESSVSRKHVIVDHAMDGCPGLLSIFGGKITNYRAIAAEAVDRVACLLGRRLGSSQTAATPLPGGGTPPERLRPAVRLRAAALGLSEEQADLLVAFYGTRAHEVLALAEDDPTLREPIVEGQPEIRAQIHYAVRREMARTSADFLLRRTGMAYRPADRLEALERISHDMAHLLNWDEERLRTDRAHSAAQLSALMPERLSHRPPT